MALFIQSLHQEYDQDTTSVVGKLIWKIDIFISPQPLIGHIFQLQDCTLRFADATKQHPFSSYMSNTPCKLQNSCATRPKNYPSNFINTDSAVTSRGKLLNPPFHIEKECCKRKEHLRGRELLPWTQKGCMEIIKCLKFLVCFRRMILALLIHLLAITKPCWSKWIYSRACACACRKLLPWTQKGCTETVKCLRFLVCSEGWLLLFSFICPPSQSPAKVSEFTLEHTRARARFPWPWKIKTLETWLLSQSFGILLQCELCTFTLYSHYLMIHYTKHVSWIFIYMPTHCLIEAAKALKQLLLAFPHAASAHTMHSLSCRYKIPPMLRLDAHDHWLQAWSTTSPFVYREAEYSYVPPPLLFFKVLIQRYQT